MRTLVKRNSEKNVENERNDKILFKVGDAFYINFGCILAFNLNQFIKMSVHTFFFRENKNRIKRGNLFLRINRIIGGSNY